MHLTDSGLAKTISRAAKQQKARHLGVRHLTCLTAQGRPSFRPDRPELATRRLGREGGHQLDLGHARGTLDPLALGFGNQLLGAHPTRRQAPAGGRHHGLGTGLTFLPTTVPEPTLQAAADREAHFEVPDGGLGLLADGHPGPEVQGLPFEGADLHQDLLTPLEGGGDEGDSLGGSGDDRKAFGDRDGGDDNVLGSHLILSLVVVPEGEWEDSHRFPPLP